ncbi:MAG: haloacid dehalogenase [Actinomycetota bacterium]|nr:haloacid dehalogenase [Actinomycetota bacterium]
MDLNEIAAGIRKRLEAKSAAREKGLTASRNAIRFCANSIRAVHRAEMDLARELQGKARAELDAAQQAMADFPDIYHAGFLHDAEKEYAEARATYALINHEELPLPEELRVGDAAYLNGLSEAIGELRRNLLDIIRHGHLERGEELLSAMDDIYYVLVSMDFPDAITGGLRRSTDVARSIMERSRGDLSITIVQRGVQEAIERARRDIAEK